MADDDDSAMGDGLQVELFHAETDREPGDTNWQGYGFDVHPQVFPIAGIIVLAFVAFTLAVPDTASEIYSGIFSGINDIFGWFYILVVNIFILVILFFAFSKYGNIRIGGVEAEPEFSNFAWYAMLFSAGMGIGLMFFSVAEPMWHLQSGGGTYFGFESGSAQAAQAALGVTYFHWGFHPWAIYGLVALGLSFFSFNRGLPLTFRSIFWPVLGERIYGWPGHVIDIVTVFATLFGLSTSLGLGAQQINAGFNFLSSTYMPFTIPGGSTAVQVAIIAGITAIATVSVAAGLEGGVKRLSNINMGVMLLLLAAVLIAGPTLYMLESFVQGMGFYLVNLPGMAFYTEAFGGTSWQNLWTVFYWGWWIAWSPFVGMFIARISKGRTVREFVLGVLFLPSLFSTVWLSTFGGSALRDSVVGEGSGAVVGAYNELGYGAFETLGMFVMLEQYPLGAISASLATLLVITFFVTSSDSGSLVIDHLTSGGKHDVPKTQRIFWAVTEGAVAAILLWGGGLTALRVAAVSTGLPFAVILTLMCYTVYKGLKNEYEILESEEFAETIEEITGEEDVDVVTTGSETVTDITESDDAPGD